MGFKKYFFTFLFLLTGLIIAGWFFATNGRLIIASWQLTQDLKTTKNLNLKPAHLKACELGKDEKLFEEDRLNPLLGYQLRFLNSNTYTIEAICRKDFIGPFEVVVKTLPPGIAKVAGSGVAFYISQNKTTSKDSYVLLSLNNKYRRVGVNNEKIINKPVSDPTLFSVGNSPIKTTCEGWNLKCCDAITQAGVGETKAELISCQDNCFQTCLDRPIITIFNTDPPPNPDTRILVITPPYNQLVRFGYKIVDPDGHVAQVVLNYGDGQLETTTEDSQILEHDYLCNSTQCQYEAHITAFDEDGLELAKTRLQTIKIVINQK